MLGGTVLFSVAQVLVRKMSATESLWSFPFYFYMGMILLTGFLFHDEFVMPQGRVEIFAPIAAGILDAVTLCLFYGALRLARASVVAPFQFTSLIWVTMLDIVLWSQYPPLHAYAGAVIVIAAGIYLLRTEKRARPPG